LSEIAPRRERRCQVAGNPLCLRDRTRGAAMIALYRLLAFAAFLVLWWAAAKLAGTNLIPTPLATAAAAREMFAEATIWRAIGESLAVYAGGYLLAVLVGIPTGLLMGGFRLLGRTLEIYVNALTATPRVAFIPLIIVLLGLGYEAKVAIIFLGAVMPLVINTYAGVLNADGELVEMARSAGATRGQIFRRILLPGALPFIVVGLRLGATIGLINTVVAELYTAVRGLGGLLAVFGNTFQMAPYFVVVFVLAAIGTLVTQGLRLIEVRIDRWRYEGG
jgi:NitT/TauT family transport system permease protein